MLELFGSGVGAFVSWHKGGLPITDHAEMFSPEFQSENSQLHDISF